MDDHEALLARLTGTVASWMVPSFVAVGLVLGLATSALGEARRINLHTAPILVLVGWNVLVYLALVAARGSGRRGGVLVRPLVAWLAGWRIRQIAGRAARMADIGQAVERWLAANHDVLLARTSLALHLGAAAFMTGATGGMYLRGVGFEYLAGWESTFLDASGVHTLLAIVLRPGEWLTGIPVGDVSRLEAIRFHDGSGGGPATHWIHLFAAAGLIWVIVPRLALAIASAWRLRRAERATTTRREVVVTAYGLVLDEAAQARVRSALIRALGLTIRVSFSGAGQSTAGDRALVFALATTPEDEVQGALLRETHPRAVLIDERSFAARFGSDDEVMTRRRAAWTAFLQRLGHEPVFMAAPA